MTRTGDREFVPRESEISPRADGMYAYLSCLRCCPFHGYLTWNKSEIKPVDSFCQANKKFSLKGHTCKSTVLRGSTVELVRTRE